eukprot:CAMPEP_0168510972 /NCGR_PEP_ID=MMETSP0405-20121227/1811_1 /TAXON_ID=498012 /ORGANISM="Trichosphaerium sp, Strain Am-I-7 wt" /LENGTH=278 /DNA_ID=CAMNT_0008528967 /DNA_START=128 /DNA_END=964 /DNA_ORIENTATION=+
MTAVGAPILCTEFAPDGAKVFTGACDGKAQLWDLQANKLQAIGKHDQPIRHMAWVANHNLLVTGGWDKTLKYWDCRQPNPSATVQMPERVYAMDIVGRLGVIGCANRHILAFDMQKPQTPLRKVDSPLKCQTRCIACFPDATGFALGSIEGRVAIHYVNQNRASDNFAFKCHREGKNVHAVNCIAFNSQYGTFATCGSDGTFHFWDKNSKQRLKQFKKCAKSITAAAFSPNSSAFAYAVSYDWSKGVQRYNPSDPNSIYIHGTPPGEIQSRAKPNRRH